MRFQLVAKTLVNVEYEKKRVATQPPRNRFGQTIAPASVERNTQGGARSRGRRYCRLRVSELPRGRQWYWRLVRLSLGLHATRQKGRRLCHPIHATQGARRRFCSLDCSSDFGTEPILCPEEPGHPKSSFLACVTLLHSFRPTCRVKLYLFQAIPRSAIRFGYQYSKSLVRLRKLRPSLDREPGHVFYSLSSCIPRLASDKSWLYRL